MRNNLLFSDKEWKEICDRGIENPGNHYRISKVIHKANEGKEIKIGFIGGSITAGSLSSTPETCYAYLVYSWWKKRFPKADVGYINAGIGATTSQYGIARVNDDLLRYEPDVVFVEFSVNDSSENKYMDTYESLIRRILTHSKEPAVIIINNVCYDNGDNVQEIHNKVGKYYDLPIVSIKNSIYAEIEKGNLKAEKITPDNLHPNDLGHSLVAGVVTNLLDKIYEGVLNNQAENEVYTIPDNPLTKISYINSRLFNNTNLHPVMEGFSVDTSQKEGLWDVFKQGWYGIREGDKIRFSAECYGLSVLYRKYAKRSDEIETKAPIARLVVDKREDEAAILDARFDQDWGDCLYLHDILHTDSLCRHTIEITITTKEESKNFYLASIIIF